MPLVSALAQEKVWIDKPKYDDAEIAYYQRAAQALITPLAKEVAKARQQLLELRNQFPDPVGLPTPASIDANALKFFEKKIVQFQNVIKSFENRFNMIESRLISVENLLQQKSEQVTTNVTEEEIKQSVDNEADDEEVDLFGSESEEENEESAKIREERLAAYNAKKSKKPQLIAKSNIILDIKPWDDETDMKEMEENVRKIESDGLVWGAAKLVPLAYGIYKLQISCVVEDEKVSIDWLQEEIETLEDFVQSVDIAAFNKV